MDTYISLKDNLLEGATALRALLARARQIPGVTAIALDDWERTCRQSHHQLTDERMRVAVVGSIKSGKSTFVNALLGRDHLKRGAGIVTSIVTRIHRGERLEARLRFKSWETVNDELAQALVLLPALQQRLSSEPFDLRRSRDREALADAFGTLNRAALIADGTQDPHSVLIASYLEGYAAVYPHMAGEERVVVFRGPDFGEHRRFVGDDRLSVYLNDVTLEIDDGPLADGVEIADCQGSDSPNPHHLAMIQDYLLQTHLIVYVISSRTGVRQADLRFLSIIRKMGIGANMLFVLNCDLNEHASLEDLQRLAARTWRELAAFHPAPEMFAGSALYHLFLQQDPADLPPREAAMRAHWDQSERLAAFSRQETARFSAFFQRQLVDERRRLLLDNHVERLAVVAEGLGRWARLRREVLAEDADASAGRAARIERDRQRIEEVRHLVRATLEGAVSQRRGELRRSVDRFFSRPDNPPVEAVYLFVRQYAADPGRYRETLNEAGFSGALYLLFQDFRQALEGHLAEVFTPEMLRFIHETEGRLLAELTEAAQPIAVMAHETLAALEGGEAGRPPRLSVPEAATVQHRAGLRVPSAAAPLRFSARIRTEATARFGFYTAVAWARRLLRKSAPATGQRGERALADALQRIRGETVRALDFHFKNFRENIKFQYLLKLLDAAAAAIEEAVDDQLRLYDEDLSQLAGRIAAQGAGRRQVEDALEAVAADAGAVHGRLLAMREALGKMGQG